MKRVQQELGLYLSEKVDAREGGRIDRIAQEAGVTLRRYTRSRPPPAPDALHAAFFSRELYEGSTLRKPGPASNAFFEVVDTAPNLKWLHVCSSGLDLPQYSASLARGVKVTPSSGTTAAPIAQSVLAAVLAHSRGFIHWLDAQQRREWAPLRGAAAPRDISEQHALVLGAGPIGLEIGRLLKAVGFRTTVGRRTAVPTPPFDACVPFAGIDGVLPGCDWLILALPLTEDTHQIIDAERLALLPPHARMVNIARGELVDANALIAALESGRLAGAYLDTFAVEPLPADSPLWTLPGVWITPHNCAASQGHEQRVVESFIRELRAWLREQAAGSPSLSTLPSQNRIDGVST